MPTIAENLQTLIDIKAGLKESLTNQGKEPTDAMGTYAGLIDGLENPDDVEYLLTVDGETAVYAQLHGEEKVDLNATANDIRKGSVAVNNGGVITGEKEIPGYFVNYGYKAVAAGSEAVVNYQPGVKSLLMTIAPFDTSVSNSVLIKYVSVENSIYEANTTNKLSDISIDLENKQIKLGVSPDARSILRYFIVREEV